MKALCIFLLNMLAWTVLAMIIRGGLDGFDEHTWSTILIASLFGVYDYKPIDKNRKKSKRKKKKEKIDLFMVGTYESFTDKKENGLQRKMMEEQTWHKKE
ncbi:TPA: hypothetical protein VY157_001392 [Streptococcus pneumoniae]|nr:hypothetical protein [Streptococcus pneumoniae]HEV4806713.1 hypothetical protein [Streptococcus pneumoniae]